MRRQCYAWTIITGALWELLASVTLALGSREQQNVGFATAHALLFLLAPLWINAFCYTTAARLVHFLLPDRTLFLPARKLAVVFVALDIAAFVVQGVGGVMAGPGSSADVARIGLRVYTGGVAGQLGCICVFGAMLARLWVRLVRIERETGEMVALGPVGEAAATTDPYTSPPPSGLEAPPYAAGALAPAFSLPAPSLRRHRWRPVLAALLAALFLIAARISFRIAEFARGENPAANPLPFHEAYQYVFDAVPMMLALIILLVVHPGKLLQGPGSEFPSRRERKEEKRIKKEERRARREERKRPRVEAEEIV
jgi:hypothetical protein